MQVTLSIRKKQIKVDTRACRYIRFVLSEEIFLLLSNI